MSYCHQLSPGISNVAMSFGLNHRYGVDPERVPSWMSDFVVDTAGSNPTCLAPVSTDLIFADGFESGHVSAWSSSAP
jgi:hypothetical protein